jgi:hypothetical protein
MAFQAFRQSGKKYDVVKVRHPADWSGQPWLKGPRVRSMIGEWKRAGCPELPFDPGPGVAMWSFNGDRESLNRLAETTGDSGAAFVRRIVVWATGAGRVAGATAARLVIPFPDPKSAASQPGPSSERVIEGPCASQARPEATQPSLPTREAPTAPFRAAYSGLTGGLVNLAGFFVTPAEAQSMRAQYWQGQPKPEPRPAEAEKAPARSAVSGRAGRELESEPSIWWTLGPVLIGAGLLALLIWRSRRRERAAGPAQAAALATRVAEFKEFLAGTPGRARPRANTLEQVQQWARTFGLSVSTRTV